MLFSRLSEKDKKLIESYIDRYAQNPYSNTHGRVADLSERLHEWDVAKNEYLYRLFDDRFILEKQVSYREPPSLLSQKIRRATRHGGKMQNFVNQYRKWLNSLSYEYFSTEFSVLGAFISSECLSRESMGQYSYISADLPVNIDFGDGKKIRVDANTKPMRALGKLVKMFDMDAEAFEEFRLEHSRILNTKSISGTLCLSIHPLDYMTMSMNSENWTSCMNWGEPGGYRGGTIEVMNSPMVVVAYLRSDVNDFCWGTRDDIWNSKKWRMLAVITPETILSIKSYPYHHEELAREVVAWLKELANTNLSWFYGDVQKIPACSTFEDATTHEWYNIDFREGRQMYCDWGCDTHYGCMTLNPAEPGATDADPHVMLIEYCGPTTCMCCGKTGQDYYDESYVICDNCCSYGEEEGCSCDHCGQWIPDGEDYWVGDKCYCCDCIDSVASRCALSGDYCYDEDLRVVYLASIADEPNEDLDKEIWVHKAYCTGRWGCNFGHYTKIDNPRQNDDGTYYFNREDMEEAGLNWLFDLRGSYAETYFA